MNAHFTAAVAELRIAQHHDHTIGAGAQLALLTRLRKTALRETPTLLQYYECLRSTIV